MHHSSERRAQLVQTGSFHVDGVDGCVGVVGTGINTPMNKKEAAEYLDLSTRAIERAVARGKLSVKYKKDKHGHVALFKSLLP